MNHPAPSPDWPCLTLSPDTTKVCTADTAHDTDHGAHGPGGEVTATWPRSATDRTAMEADAEYQADARSMFPEAIPATADPTPDDVATVAALLQQRGHAATVEWPGALVLPLGPGQDVWTGLHGWEYGTRNRLDPDGTCWQPTEEPADVELRPGASLVDVADAWHSFAQGAMATP